MPERLLAIKLREYLNDLVPPRPVELAAMESEALARQFPIIGPAAGYFCYLVARMIGARQIFELGSGYGYSTAWFARAVKENGGGTVHHVVWDVRLSLEAKEHLAELGHDGVVRYHLGEAVHTLRAAEGPFDLIFNDIEKQNYPDSLPVIKEKLRPGGVLIVDNMLWGGTIFDHDDHLPDTEGVRLLTHLLTSDPEWIASLVPIRDGLMVAFRRPSA